MIETAAAEPRTLRVPFLRVPCFLHGDEVRFAHGSHSGLDAGSKRLLESIFRGGSTLEELAKESVDQGLADDEAESARRLAASFADPANVIGLAELEIRPEYDVIVVEQGYGGVYVHTVELLRKLRRRWRCLLISPVEPLFEPERMEDTLTLDRLRERNGWMGYLSWIHIVRTVIARTRCKLLLITHRSQSLFLFDLLRDRNTVIYCDGFYDGAFRRAQDFRLDDGERSRHAVLSEIYYLIANSNPNFFGISSSPGLNVRLLIAGAHSLAAARENWCWGMHQQRNFAAAFPALAERIRFMPPFTDPALFHPEWVDREDVVLFTTTMHNIDRKGFPELVRAMARMPKVRVRCVVRQPHLLPPMPDSVRERMQIGPVTKEEMVRVYHRVWLNCRTSRDESSPISILEAMVCELPQIVSPVVASQIPILEDGKTGFIVDPDDCGSLVRALRSLLADRRLRDRMGRECRRRALEYSFDRRVEAFEKLLS